MTKEKVMEILNVVLKTERAYQYRKEEVNEAFDIAIEALEQQPNRCDSCVHSEEQDGSNCYECVKGMADNFETRSTDVDCISRTRLLEHLENITMDTNPDHYEDKDKWYQVNGFNLCKVGIEIYVKNLPSVTPSYNSIKTELKPSEDWKFYYNHGYAQAKRDLLCEDCISRQAVLDIINFEDEWLHDANSHNADTKIAFNGLESRVKELPSVTPQPKIGHWIDFDSLDGALWHTCSECGETEFYATDYCPNCGCRMKGEDE